MLVRKTPPHPPRAPGTIAAISLEHAAENGQGVLRATIQAYACGGATTAAQQFEWWREYNLRFKGTNMCIDVASAKQADGTALQLYTCGGRNAAQRFEAPAKLVNSIQFVSRATGAVLRTWSCATNCNTNPCGIRFDGASGGSLAGASIPRDIGLLSCRSKLNYLQLVNQRNLLDGTLPESLGQLLALTMIDVQGSGLKGGIPASLGNLDKLEIMNACCQDLNGTVSAKPRHFGQEIRLASAVVRSAFVELLRVACRFRESWARS